MAMQQISVALTNAEQGTFTFTKPAGNYGKSAGVTITDGQGSGPVSFLPDTDNGNGTMTGTVRVGGGAINGTVEISIWDKP